jgi:hypothetical protein
MSLPIVIVALCITAIFSLLCFQTFCEQYETTTTDDVDKASDELAIAIAEAETEVGRSAPHDAECRQLLEQARACLSFNKHSTRIIVTASVLLYKREEGIKLAKAATVRARAALANK